MNVPRFKRTPTLEEVNASLKRHRPVITVRPVYTVKFRMSSFRGCVLKRTFPWEVQTVDGKKILQYAKSRESAIAWIEGQHADYLKAEVETIAD